MGGRPDWLPDWVPEWVSIPAWASEAWAYFMRIWHQGVFNLTYGQIFSALGILLLALLVRGIFARTVVRAITRAASGTKTKLDDALVKSVSEPLKMVPLIIGAYFALQFMELAPEAKVAGDKVLTSLVALSVFWTLNRAVGAFSFLLGSLEKTLGWAIRTVQVAFLAMGLAAVLEIWGVQVLPVLAGLGVFGVAIAFGAQDLVKNLISGVFILIEKRFVPGEWILVSGVVEGTVEAIGFRSTTIRQFDKAPVYVPNAVFSDREVVNFSRMTHRRVRWVIGVEYRTTVQQLKYVCSEIEAYLWSHEDFARPPEAGLLVAVESFNESSIDILVYAFTRTIKWDEWLAAKERLAYRIMEIVKAAGTDFAFPSRTLYMQTVDPPQIFEPPGPSADALRLQSLKAETPAELRRGSDDDDG